MQKTHTEAMTAVVRNILLVGLGGGLGAMMRYGITLFCTAVNCPATVGTLVTNTLGSLCMGLLVSSSVQSPLLLMATVGICGGFTTYSTFSMQSVSLFQQGDYGMALLYMVGTVSLCVAFAAIGCWIGKSWL